MKSIPITAVEVNQTFKSLSTFFGFNNEERKFWISTVMALVEKWHSEQKIEVFEDDETEEFQAWGRVKDTNTVIGSSPSYTGLYHARVSRNIKRFDPLLVITIEDRQSDDGKIKHMVAVVHTMISHDRMFGDRDSGIKNNPEGMKQLRRDVRNIIDNPALAS